MTCSVSGLSAERLQAAYLNARRALLEERVSAGHWVGALSTSALSTATAISALALVAKETPAESPESGPLAALIVRGVSWLVEHQNADGGWGDTQKSYSNIATTYLATAAIHLSGTAERHADLLRRSERYIKAAGSWSALRNRYGRDKTFAVPILTNCALAGLVNWRDVSPLPFELSCFPQSMYRMLQLPVVSYAIPALVAIGQARYFHRPPQNPLTRWIRSRLVGKSLQVLERMQPASGGYLEAVPLTSFVVMSLAATGRGDHPVTRSGVRFLIDSVRPDGSWPIDTNLAAWNTTLALNALTNGGSDIAELNCLDWVLNCQTKQIHPYTGAGPGGWGWTDLTGSVPDADDTPSALLALATWSRSPQCSGRDRRRIRDAASAGIRWLLGLQNRNGGWPTFCRGWGKLPFDRSGADLTAHAIRALHVWNDLVDTGREIQRGLKYLTASQQSDGSWIPLWFGNQDHPGEENPVYGTSKVLLAYRDLGLLQDPCAHRGMAWLRAARNADGGWGGGVSLETSTAPGIVSSVEETAVAVEALLGQPKAVESGLNWLVESVETGRFRQPSPIGFYFAKLWYHERLYPIIFTTSALGRAVQQGLSPLEQGTTTSHLLTANADRSLIPERTEPKRQLISSGKDDPSCSVPEVKQPCP